MRSPLLAATPLDAESVQAALTQATQALLAERGPEGHWTGELSSSALSTATAVVALSLTDRTAHQELITRGLHWLAANVNADGGWGDTIRSKSNVSTSALVWAAFGAAQADAQFPQILERLTSWLKSHCAIRHDHALSDALFQAIEARYGTDRTFSVPILMTLILGGRLSTDHWASISPLPFELAVLPHQVFGALRLPVVSYALPALIAIGQVIHHFSPSKNPLLRGIRSLAIEPALRALTRIQPPNGGFLEATPLTSFVTMSLSAMDRRNHPVVLLGIDFLRQSIRPDGSWPIDTNLATWVTTLSIEALHSQPGWASPETLSTLRQWLLDQQGAKEHPYTHAAPGGWGWTPLPGGVPDADDTAGALLALLNLGVVDAPIRKAGIAGIQWLNQLQNRDGGMPTFCHGWGTLPFDRSSPDLTAHALRAWSAWLPLLPPPLRQKTARAIQRALHYLVSVQLRDGSWLPLWFGNEHHPDDQNFTYGTSRVLLALRELDERGFALPPGLAQRAAHWLTGAQHPSGGWSGFRGGPPSIEETALAIQALAGFRADATNSGTRWLLEQSNLAPSPIGFYFAKLWYFEHLYPKIFTVAALGRVNSTLP